MLVFDLMGRLWNATPVNAIQKFIFSWCNLMALYFLGQAKTGRAHCQEREAKWHVTFNPILTRQKKPIVWASGQWTVDISPFYTQHHYPSIFYPLIIICIYHLINAQDMNFYLPLLILYNLCAVCAFFFFLKCKMYLLPCELNIYFIQKLDILLSQVFQHPHHFDVIIFFSKSIILIYSTYLVSRIDFLANFRKW